MATTRSAALTEVERFLFHEARLQDEHRYEEWEALWTDDAVYWVPAADDAAGDQMAIIYDNRARISTRVRQLRSGARHAQRPPSSLRRLISNVELVDDADTDDVAVGANFLVVESRARGTQLWAGRTEYHLRLIEDGWRMAYKKVSLVDRDQPLYTLAFLI